MQLSNLILPQHDSGRQSDGQFSRSINPTKILVDNSFISGAVHLGSNRGNFFRSTPLSVQPALSGDCPSNLLVKQTGVDWDSGISVPVATRSITVKGSGMTADDPPAYDQGTSQTGRSGALSVHNLLSSEPPARSRYRHSESNSENRSDSTTSGISSSKIISPFDITPSESSSSSQGPLASDLKRHHGLDPEGPDKALPRHPSYPSIRMADAVNDATLAYQYAPVKQICEGREDVEYLLTIREQPKHSRMCGVGERADRRPLDPAPIIQLRVVTHDGKVHPPRKASAPSDTKKPEIVRSPTVLKGLSGDRAPQGKRGEYVKTDIGDGWEDKAWYLENPYYFMSAMLADAEADQELHSLPDGKTRYTTGSTVSCLYHLRDIDGSHQGFFVFPDLSIRVEGKYRLKLSLFETVGSNVYHCKSIFSSPFMVYTAKRFPGMDESTQLSKSFADQGLKVRVRKNTLSRRSRPNTGIMRTQRPEGQDGEASRSSSFGDQQAKRLRSDSWLSATSAAPVTVSPLSPNQPSSAGSHGSGHWSAFSASQASRRNSLDRPGDPPTAALASSMAGSYFPPGNASGNHPQTRSNFLAARSDISMGRQRSSSLSSNMIQAQSRVGPHSDARSYASASTAPSDANSARMHAAAPPHSTRSRPRSPTFAPPDPYSLSHPHPHHGPSVAGSRDYPPGPLSQGRSHPTWMAAYPQQHSTSSQPLPPSSSHRSLAPPPLHARERSKSDPRARVLSPLAPSLPSLPSLPSFGSITNSARRPFAPGARQAERSSATLPPEYSSYPYSQQQHPPPPRPLQQHPTEYAVRPDRPYRPNHSHQSQSQSQPKSQSQPAHQPPPLHPYGAPRPPSNLP